MTIQAIIKKAVQRLENEGKLLTPDFYAEAFCKEAALAKMSVGDCSHVETLSKTLNKEYQNELKQYRIKTIAELARFLISKLNRTNPSMCMEALDAHVIFSKRVLQAIDVLHNKEASELAKRSLELLDSQPSTAQIEQFRQLWVNFLTTYDDSFLLKLSSYGEIDTKDLKRSIENLREGSGDSIEIASNMDLDSIASLLVASLVPSIASSVNDKIADLSEKIKRKPSSLQELSIEEEIRSAISLRIALDKKSVKEMIESLDVVLDKLSLRLIEMIERSDDSTSEIQKIKQDLTNLNESSANNFTLAHKKLFTIALALEENTKVLSKDLRGHNNEVQILSARVKELEEELASAKAASKEDFLTKLYNKRALHEFLSVREAEFGRYEHNFTIVMFDIDHFKSVNDTYGHDAGDAVLAAFAKILKHESRSVDIVGRFGGEEFMALLSETDTKGGVIFGEKVRKHVEKARFMYKGERIAVTVSGGVAERAKFPSLQNTINRADELLYVAKHNGRNQIAYKK